MIGQEIAIKTLRSSIVNNSPYPSLVFYGSKGIGKCVPGRVRVGSSSGYIKIKDLYSTSKTHNEAEALPYHEGFNDLRRKLQTRFGDEFTSHFYFEPKCRVLNLKTSLGRVISGTENHRVLSLQDGTPVLTKMSELKEGSVLLMSTIPITGGEAADRNKMFNLGVLYSIYVESERGKGSKSTLTVSGTSSIRQKWDLVS